MFDRTARDQPVQARDVLVDRLLGAAAAVVGALWSWAYRSRHRRRLSELDDRQLRDIGLTRAQVEAEARKPFWRA